MNIFFLLIRFIFALYFQCTMSGCTFDDKKPEFGRRGELYKIQRVEIEKSEQFLTQFQIREINLLKKEQLSEEFLKINPQHCLPTLVDDGFVMWESRPIAIYLVEKNFPDGHPLYPKDVKQRALINQRLQFDASTLYQRIRAICVSFIYLLNVECDFDFD